MRWRVTAHLTQHVGIGYRQWDVIGMQVPAFEITNQLTERDAERVARSIIDPLNTLTQPHYTLTITVVSI